MNNTLSSGLQLLLLCTPLVLVTGVLWADETTLDIVAATVRDQGHECETPQGIEPDNKDTAPDEKAWIIRCENETFRVKYMGDDTPAVEPVNR